MRHCPETKNLPPGARTALPAPRQGAQDGSAGEGAERRHGGARGQRRRLPVNEGVWVARPAPLLTPKRKPGRSLMRVTRGGTSLGAVLVNEGLAEEWGGARRAWC
jgi:endonuclease YncB( thermonuclease family)